MIIEYIHCNITNYTLRLVWCHHDVMVDDVLTYDVIVDDVMVYDVIKSNAIVHDVMVDDVIKT